MPDPWHNWFRIYSVISDYNYRSVSVRLISQATTHLSIDGHESNTFTGSMLVDGPHLFSLNKLNGAIAIQKGLVLSNKAQLHIGYTRQFGRQATVNLNNASFGFWGMDGNERKEVFHQLVVSDESELNFNAGGYYAKGAIFLDDLKIEYWWGSLLIKNWKEDGTTRLFVSKDSWSLEDALGKIRFEGKSDSAGVRSYNWEYWEIGIGYGFSKLPEPSTYGAIFGGLGLFVVLRRNGRCFWRRKPHFRPKQKGRLSHDQNDDSNGGTGTVF